MPFFDQLYTYFGFSVFQLRNIFHFGSILFGIFQHFFKMITVFYQGFKK